MAEDLLIRFAFLSQAFGIHLVDLPFCYTLATLDNICSSKYLYEVATWGLLSKKWTPNRHDLI